MHSSQDFVSPCHETPDTSQRYDGKPAFSDLYRRWYLPVRSFIARYGYEGELDDLTQEVFLKVWKSLHLFRGQSSLKTWVFQIALRRCPKITCTT